MCSIKDVTKVLTDESKVLVREPETLATNLVRESRVFRSDDKYTLSDTYKMTRLEGVKVDTCSYDYTQIEITFLLSAIGDLSKWKLIDLCDAQEELPLQKLMKGC